jgi:hypothetical protein
VSAPRRAKDATPWKSTAITARANLPSGQKVLDAPKQATETAKKGKEGVRSADSYVRAPPFHSDTNSYFDLNLSLIWSRPDYAATLTTIWAKPR